MHDALASSQLGAPPSFRSWSDHVLALVDDQIERSGEMDVLRLAEALADVTHWPSCPRVYGMAEGDALSYQRTPITHRGAAYEAPLILWPPGHATPIHDHAGLWGLELVLDGVLEVETYALSPHHDPQLTSEGTVVLGEGDHASFSGVRHAHRCRNFSLRKPALTLHIYGGVLDAYRSFHLEDAGRWLSAVHCTDRAPALT